MSAAQIRGSIYWKIGHSRTFKLVEISPIAKAFRAKKSSDLISRAIDSFSAWNGGVAPEVLVQRRIPRQQG
jgi:hypothetical protein